MNEKEVFLNDYALIKHELDLARDEIKNMKDEIAELHEVRKQLESELEEYKKVENTLGNTIIAMAVKLAMGGEGSVLK